MTFRPVRTAAAAAAVVALSLGTVSLAACDDQGPAERTGERIDDAVEETQRTIRDATD